MTYHSYHSTYELAVRTTGPLQYMVIFQPYAPGAAEVVLHAFSTEDEAIRAAKAFPERYQLAVVRGYVLEQSYFIHSSGKAIHVSFAMDLSISNEKFRHILDPADA